MFSDTTPVSRQGIIDRRQLRQLARQVHATGEVSVLGADSYTGSAGRVVSVSTAVDTKRLPSGGGLKSPLSAVPDPNFPNQVLLIGYPNLHIVTVTFQNLIFTTRAEGGTGNFWPHPSLLNFWGRGVDGAAASSSFALYDGFQSPEPTECLVLVNASLVLEAEATWPAAAPLRLDLLVSSDPPASPPGAGTTIIASTLSLPMRPEGLGTHNQLIPLQVSAQIPLFPGQYLFLQVVNLTQFRAFDLAGDYARVPPLNVWNGSFEVIKLFDAPPGGL